ncbi:MAG: NAD-dependent succinate-semialdehyde dehydrogenase [Flavobacteriales bacterium]|nr:Succinate-semialdehyde dehydrogenase [NADP(+)] GabD [Flavobacteriales bacterium]MCC6577580.1 NAD-dependent succinate-semialdehyde dehydrogenase [Flavobacteriales bacterium]NUQ14640.1 NAD-dependent succinate-semialdehyde dehydrogenase [Flavobacteriales bacterium]
MRPPHHTETFIAGTWRPARTGTRFTVRDPGDGTEVGSCPDCDGADATAAIAAAYEARGPWAGLAARERAAVLMRWHAAILRDGPALAEVMTRESGKPLAESLAEVRYGASFLQWCAEEAPRALGAVIPAEQADRRLLVVQQPVGVVAAITPWNFPLSMVTRKVAPALAAGCTVVLKPSELTPLTALALVRSAEGCGLPPGVLNVVPTTDPAAVGAVLTGDPRVRMLSFTGSTAVGKRLMAQAAGTVKHVSLELGGNAPALVFDDADPVAAADAIVASRYRNTGQTCVCTNRVLVQNGVAEAFLHALSERVEALRMGHGLTPGVQVGPLIDHRAVAKVMRLLEDAVARGARPIVGGPGSVRDGRFVAPTVLVGVTPEMACMQEEIFGPVLPVMRFAREDEAVAVANATTQGLAAYIFTRDLARSWRVSEALEAGMVGINTGLISTAAAPFGGVKESGLGREGGPQALAPFLEPKYIAVAGLR